MNGEEDEQHEPKMRTYVIVNLKHGINKIPKINEFTQQNANKKHFNRFIVYSSNNCVKFSILVKTKTEQKKMKSSNQSGNERKRNVDAVVDLKKKCKEANMFVR